MATLTASSFAKTPRSMPSGVISAFGTFNSGSTKMEASAQTVFMLKLPNRSQIIDVIEHHTTGATSAPTDIGIDASLSALASQATQGIVNRVSIGQRTPYQVSISDDATANYGILKVTPTLASSTTSYIVNITVLYTMDP